MEVLISRFIEDPEMDLSPFEGEAMQVAFFRRKTFQGIDHHRLNARLKENGITVRSVHAPACDIFHREGEEFLRTLETIRNEYGVNVITVHPQKGTKETARRELEALEGHIRDLGVTLAYETFEKETIGVKWVSQVEEMHHTFDAFSLPFLRVTYDFTHSTWEENIEEVTRCNHLIEVIHLSDALRNRPLDSNEFHQHLPLGLGDYRVTEFLDLLERISYRHFIVVEYHPQYDSFLRDDAAGLRSWFKGNREPLLTLMDERSARKARKDC